eukprot:139281-Rhodomonas_salina.1
MMPPAAAPLAGKSPGLMSPPPQPLGLALQPPPFAKPPTPLSPAVQISLARPPVSLRRNFAFWNAEMCLGMVSAYGDVICVASSAISRPSLSPILPPRDSMHVWLFPSTVEPTQQMMANDDCGNAGATPTPQPMASVASLSPSPAPFPPQPSVIPAHRPLAAPATQNPFANDDGDDGDWAGGWDGSMEDTGAVSDRRALLADKTGVDAAGGEDGDSKGVLSPRAGGAPSVFAKPSGEIGAIRIGKGVLGGKAGKALDARAKAQGS